MTEFLTSELVFFVTVGFVAQLVDGALGMAYGLMATTVLLAAGTPPAFASASVHTAEVVTTGLAGASHVWHRNIDWLLFRRLALAGVAGGVLGAYVLVGLPQDIVRVLVTFYLIGLTIVITWRIVAREKPSETKLERERRFPAVPIGAAGGFLDAVGGGGWGPIVTSTLLARGDPPRDAIGSASLAEFFLTCAISVTFLSTLDVWTYWKVVLGLIIGGAIAAPLAGFLSKVLAPRILMGMVATVIIILSVYNLVRLMM